MGNLTPSSSKPGLPQFSDPAFLRDRFNPGEWLDRRQANAASCVAISGHYERLAPVSGGIYSPDVHFYDLCLAHRPADARGHLIDCFREPQPLGEIIFVPAGYRYRGGGGPGKQRNLFVFLNAEKLRAEDPQLADILASRGTRDFMNLQSDTVRFLLTRICRELYDPGFASELMIEGLATTLLAETARLLNQDQASRCTRGGLAPATLRKIHERLQDGKAPPSLTELADLCNLSQRQLMRGFRESTGQTVGQFIQETVLEKAKTLLRTTDLPINAIAAELGFVSTSSFSTAFRRLAGESPRAFRTRVASCDTVLKSFHAH